MISRPHRFHGHASLRFVYQRGKTVRGQFVALRYQSNPRRDHYRAAVVVSRKVHKSAVVRNRIRRRIYEIIRQHLANDLPPVDLVFTVFSDRVATMEAAELKQQVLALVDKAQLR